MTRARHAHERPVGERHAHGLSLAAVSVRGEETPGDAGARDATTAARAGSVAVGERGDYEVALLDMAHLGADVLDHAGELVSDRPRVERRVAPVVPEVRAADARQHDADHGIGRFSDHRVGAIGYRD